MSQSGLHGITGLYFGQAARQTDSVPAWETRDGAFKFGLVLGNLIPDVDFFLLGPMYLVKPALALSMHRTWSHSLIIQALVVLVLRLVWTRGQPMRQGFLHGLWIGMAMHSAADIFLWFSPVDLFWPLGWWGLPSSINLWAQVSVPGVVSNLLGAADYLFFALFFSYLAAIAKRQGTDAALLPLIRRINGLLYALTIVYALLSLRLPPALYNLVDYALFIVFFLPFELWLVWRMRETIARA